MDLRTDYECPPIPVRHYDWHCYDADTYDITGFDGETGQPYSNCPVGYGATEFDAVFDFVMLILERGDISVSELMEETLLCERCGEERVTHQALVREEMLSDERGTVWGHVDMWLCDECDRESGPDPDLLYDEWRDRQMEEGQ